MVQEAHPAPTTSSQAVDHFDAVIVGTSPMCMIAALIEREAGKHVLMVDSAETAGGTWRVTDLLGYANVELGCHELDAIEPVYRLFEDLGIPMVIMEPQPFYVSQEPPYFPTRLQFHHRWLRELHDLLRGRMNYDLDWSEQPTLKTRIRTALRVGRQASRDLRGTNRPARYPANGAIDIVGRLHELAQTADISIRCDTWLTDVVIDREAGLVRCRLDGTNVTTARLHITSSTDLEVIDDGNQRIQLGGNPTCWQTLYLSLDACPKPAFTYLVFYNPELLHRASDLSRYAIRGAGVVNSRLIALTIDENAPETESTAIEALLRMQEYGLIDRKARLRDFAYLPYHFSRIDEWRCRELDRLLQPYVEVHVTNVLTPSINSLLKRGNNRELMRRMCRRLSEGAH